MPCEVSVISFVAPGIAWSNDGQPVPESNFASDANKGLPQATQRYMPSAVLWSNSPVNGASVPPSRNTAYCSGVNFSFQLSSVSFIYLNYLFILLSSFKSAIY